MGRLKDKRVLITGSASGIGRAAARLFAAEGARLTLCDRDHLQNKDLAHEIDATGGHAQAIQTDVGEPDDMQNAVNTAVATYGGLDVLYNNAGGATGKDGSVTEIELDEFWRTIRVDLFGTVLGCRFAIPHLVQAGGGSIINTTSMRAMIGTEGADAYTSAKGGGRHIDSCPCPAMGSGRYTRQCNCARRHPHRPGAHHASRRRPDQS